MAPIYGHEIMSPPPDPPPSGRRSVGAIVLIGLGLLVLVPSGLCTGVAGLIGIFNLDRDGAGFLGLVLIIGGLPILIGTAFLVIGLKMPRRE
jgi:hypothetical protein